MKKRQGSLKNHLKNLVLVLLTLLLALLVALNWGTGLGRDNAPADSFFAQVYALLPMGDGGYIQRAGDTPAAYPSGIAMTAGDGLRGASYNETAEGSLYESVRPLWADALAGARSFEKAEEAALQEALRGDTLFLSYNSSLPLSLLAGWMGADPAHTDSRSVASLVLTRGGVLYVRDGADGMLYRTVGGVKVDAGVWERVAAGVTAPPCSYAGTLDTQVYGALLPETLVPEGAAAYDVLQARMPAFGDPASGDSLQTLLGAFSYDPYVTNYSENDGATQVFVENYSALRVSQDGQVRFKANSLSGGLPAYQEGEVDAAGALAAQVDYAHEVLNAALGAVGSTIPAELESVRLDAESGAWNVQFNQTVGGLPVRRADGQPLARFTFQDGMLVAAELSLRDYVSTGEKLYVLPVAQAAAALDGASQYGYVVAYTDDGSGRLLPAAYRKDWRGGSAVG